MGKTTGNRIILVGFSTTGKSKAGRIISQRLGWELVDIDDTIVAASGKPIDDIFAHEGEKRFREIERDILQKACKKEKVIIACGGGAVIDPSHRDLMRKSGVVICLEAQPKTIYERLRTNDTDAVRPLLSGPDQLKRIETLKESRQYYYNAVADWTVHTDALTLDEVGDEVMRGWRYGVRRFEIMTSSVVKKAAFMVNTQTSSYPVYIGSGLIGDLGKQMRSAGLSGTVSVISDDNVFSLYGSKVVQILEKDGFVVDSYVVRAGEQTKSVESAVKIYDWLIERNVERVDTIVALGGGMVGDLAGFVAATYLRGVPLVHVPTSLLAMVDASIGGKVAVNHPRGKNLIGSFYQPGLVFTDVAILKTLPKRELTSGWSEVIKHALILDADLFEFFDRECEKLLELDESVLVDAVVRSTAIKAGIVSTDEKEAGRRMLLNYGHTIAHGLEAAAGYDRFLHGEAVAVGMMGAAMISERLQMIDAAIVQKQRTLLERYGLPVFCRDIDIDRVIEAIELDKKVRNKTINWVLLAGIGNAVIRNDVPHDLVESVIRSLIRY